MCSISRGHLNICHPPTKLQEGNVFSYVCLLEGVPCGYYPWCIRPHWTGPPALSRHGTSPYKDPPVPALLDMEPYCTWTPSHPASDILWPSLETCSNLFTSGSLLSPSVEIWWLLKQVRSAQAGGIHPAFQSGKSQGILKRLEKSGKITQNTWKLEFQTHVISYF